MMPATHLARPPRTCSSQHRLQYFSMFSGIGGFELAIQRVTPDAVCVGYSEIDRPAISVYERKFRSHVNFGDAETIDIGRLRTVDLLVAGFPCQPFSIAGRRRGFDDARGRLFFAIARVLEAKRPQHLVLENVKGLLSVDGGQAFASMLGVLAELGYFVEWQVLNSKNFGVPQNRERVILVGHLGSVPRQQVFPFRAASRTPLVQLNRPRHSNDRIYSSEGVSPALNTMQGGNRQPFVAVDPPPVNGLAAKLAVTKAVAGVPAVRRLTPLECERLQGFPDNWTKYGAAGQVISDSQRYKLCGNSVTVNVVQAVFERLFHGAA